METMKENLAVSLLSAFKKDDLAKVSLLIDWLKDNRLTIESLIPLIEADILLRHFQTALTIEKVFDDSGVKLEDLNDYIIALTGKEKREQEIERQRRLKQLAEDGEAWAKRGRKCPTHGVPLILYPVNTNDKDQVGGDYKSQQMCPDPNCDYEEFSLESVIDVLNKVGIEVETER